MNPSLSRRASDEQDAAHQRRERRQLDVLRRFGHGAHRHEAGRQDRGRRRVRADDEVSRRPEDREQDDRQEDRVQAGDDRHAGDLRVAHDLGDRERRERRAGDHVGADPRLDRWAGCPRGSGSGRLLRCACVAATLDPPLPEAAPTDARSLLHGASKHHEVMCASSRLGRESRTRTHDAGDRRPAFGSASPPRIEWVGRTSPERQPCSTPHRCGTIGAMGRLPLPSLAEPDRPPRRVARPSRRGSASTGASS